MLREREGGDERREVRRWKGKENNRRNEGRNRMNAVLSSFVCTFLLYSTVVYTQIQAYKWIDNPSIIQKN